jgi:Fuc2NAc and GlcNAc transferase
MTILVGILLFFSSSFITGLTRLYALRSGLLDVPNQRSSHRRPTPRGGGVGFVVSFIGFLITLILWSTENRTVALALIGGLPIAIVGWLDDRYTLSAALRFAVHGLMAAWALYWLGGLPQLNLGLWQLPLGIFGYALGWLGIVWLINLYNFMDGIDGLAAGEAVLVALAAGIMLIVTGAVQLGLICLMLAAAVGGFLVWNWPPAKIFMGDVGSGMLGYTFAVFALYSENQGALPLIGWLILLSVFVVDATATLIARVLRGEKWTKPHNTHAYQLAVKRGYSHRTVTSSLLGITAALGLLTGIAWYYGLIAQLLIISLMLLLALWWQFITQRS